jgi:hypothetical protein
MKTLHLPNHHLSHPCCSIRTCLDRPLPAATRGALAVDKRWPAAQRNLRVRFLDGEPAVQALVMRFAQEWSNYANLTFTFGDDPAAEIRISFRQPGSWSYIGTDALGIAADAPTMNFGWLTPSVPPDETMRVVLHEFGHALGLVHEHQNPAATIPWNRQAVYDYYSGPPNFWTREEVDRNLFQRYAHQSTQFSAFDHASIMLYPIPQEFTDGDFAVGWNQTLSVTDKTFIAAMYP